MPQFWLDHANQQGLIFSDIPKITMWDDHQLINHSPLIYPCRHESMHTSILHLHESRALFERDRESFRLTQTNQVTRRRRKEVLDGRVESKKNKKNLALSTCLWYVCALAAGLRTLDVLGGVQSSCLSQSPCYGCCDNRWRGSVELRFRAFSLLVN